MSERLAAVNPNYEPELVAYNASWLAGRPIEPSVLVDAGKLVIWDAATGMQKINRFRRFLGQRPEDLAAVRATCLDEAELVLRGLLTPPRSQGHLLVNQMRAAMQNILRREMVFYGYFEGVTGAGNSSVLTTYVDPATLDYQQFRHGEDDYTGASFSDVYSSDSSTGDDRPALEATVLAPKYLPSELRGAASRIGKREGLTGAALKERVADLLMQPAILAALDTDYKCRNCLGMIERGGMIRVGLGNFIYGYCSGECAFAAGKAKRVSDRSVDEIKAAIAAAAAADAKSALRAMLAADLVAKRLRLEGTDAAWVGARQRAGFRDFVLGRDGSARPKRGAKRAPVNKKLFRATARSKAEQAAVARLSVRERFVWDHQDEPHGSIGELAFNIPGGPVEEATYRQIKHRTIARVARWTDEILATGSPNVIPMPTPRRRRRSS